MRSRLGWALVCALTLPIVPASLHADVEVKARRAKSERASPPFTIDYRLLSEVAETEPNDAPGQADLLGCGNTFRPASIAVQAVRDTDWIRFTANAGDLITLGTDADGPTPVGDTRITIFPEVGDSLGTDDDGGPGDYSLLSICAPYTGTYYVRIAAFGSETGTYMAFLVCSASSAPNDQCAGAINVPCGAIDLSGTTATACPNYSPGEKGCTGFPADGRDVVYKLTVIAGDSLYIDYAQSATDASIYLVTDCSDPAGTCVAGEDGTLVGEHETLSYKFTSPGTYYLVLDSFSAGSGGPWTATGVFACAPDEIDPFASAHLDLDLYGPWGMETVGLNGTAILNATIRALVDPDTSNREQVPIELAQLDLAGNSLNAGPVTVRVRQVDAHPFQRSGGRIQEYTNLTPGVLDLPPFGPGGMANALVQTYLEVELPVLKQFLHNDTPLPLLGAISHEPPAAAEYLTNLSGVTLVDPLETSTPYGITFCRLTLNPAVALDTLENSRMTLDLLGPLGLETVTLKGTTALRARLGNVSDADGDGLEQVESGIDGMTLSGVSLLYGPVQVSLSPPAPHSLPETAGEIEENVNVAGALLEIAPFSWGGTASSFLDLYLSLDVGGARYHNHAAKHLAGTITVVPPAPGELYRNFVPTPLFGDGDATSSFQARRMILEPYDTKADSTVIDSFPDARLVVDLQGPWGFDQLVMSGSVQIETQLGPLVDPDADQLEQVPTRITYLNLVDPTFAHLPDPVTLQLGDSLVLGQHEETVNYTPQLLDVPPFTPVGAAASYFDMNFDVFFGSEPLHNAQAIRAAATFAHLPHLPGDTYAFAGDVELLDAGGLPSGIRVTGLRLTPRTADGTVDVPGEPAPLAFAIREIRPNPTTGSATVALALPRPAQARVAAYDVNGRLVRTLWSGPMEAGMRTLNWDGRGDRGERVPGGIYFIRLESEGRLAVRRLAILR